MTPLVDPVARVLESAAFRVRLHQAGWRADISGRMTTWLAPDGKRYTEQEALAIARMWEEGR